MAKVLLGQTVRNEVKLVEIEVTPDLARQWLAESNDVNRPMRLAKARELAASMPHAWELDPTSAICFGKSGRLLNGQHRLMAVTICGEPVRMLVVFDEVDDGVQKVMDTGLSWTTADKLSLNRQPNAKQVAAIARVAAGTLARFGEARDAYEFANKYPQHCEPFCAIARLSGHGAPVAGAFAKASLLGMRGVHEAGERLVGMAWKGDGDPMQALAKRLRANNKIVNAKGRYAVAVSAIRAVHEGRAITLAKEATLDLGQIPTDTPKAQVALELV